MNILTKNSMSYHNVYKIADHIFSLETLFEYTHNLCLDYLSEEPPSFTISIKEEDIEYERVKAQDEALHEGFKSIEFSSEYLESLAVLRKFANIILKDSYILFHGSSLSYNNDGYIFTAKSGTGKSTHTKFWQKTFGEECVMINDDKPILKIEKNGVTVYGSPWNGKHNIGNNIAAPLKVISILNRGEKNEVFKIDKNKAFGMLLQQTYRPEGIENMTMLLPLIDTMADNVKLFNIYCNLDESTALEIYNGMKGQTYEVKE